MDSQKVDLFIMTNAEYFEAHQLAEIKERLLNLDDSKWSTIQTVKLKKPQTGLIFSLLLGSYGVDRFWAGDTGKGVGKLLTCGGFGVWTIIDWFTIQSSIRAKNYITIKQFIY